MTDAVETKVSIRDIELISEVRDAELLQKEVWGIQDDDVVPLTQLVAAREAGGILIGAFDGPSLVGFAYGFVGLEGGHLTIHSHMLAVKPEYRNHNLGYRLKMAQREQALSKSIRRITWTFDPLQSLNAHFNFNKLGVVADRYKVNFYGEQTSILLEGAGTDRLWVSWLIDSPRVCERLEKRNEASRPAVEAVAPLVQAGPDFYPQRNDLAAGLSGEHALIEIPTSIGVIEEQRKGLALEWRRATRWAFTEALASGYLVEDFLRLPRDDRATGVYLLSRGKKVEDFSLTTLDR